MKVRVTKPCFIDSRLRTVGAEIDIRAELFSAACMKQLDSPEQSEAPAQPESAADAQADPGNEAQPADAPSAAPKRRGRPSKQRTE